MKTADMNLMKRINRDVLRGVMKGYRRATKPRLADLTGLSIVTVGSLVDELVKNGELLAGQPQDSNGGRPALVYEFNPRHATAVILYSGEIKGNDVLHLAVIDLYGAVLAQSELHNTQIDADHIQQEIERWLLLYPSAQVIGIGLPGQETNGVLRIMDYENLRGTKLIGNLREAVKLPVFFENDVNAAVYGYCVHNRLEEENVVGVYIPEKYPLGVGMLLNGKTYQGRDGLAGEMAASVGVVNWKDTAYINSHLKEAVTNLVHNLTCLLNPHEIVIYREGLEERDIHDWLNALIKEFPNLLYPRVRLSRQFHQDFSIGMKAKAVEALEKRYQTMGEHP